MDMQELIAPFAKLIEASCAPAEVRAVEAGGAADAMWQAIAESGFLDALVAEEQGGAGLPMAAVGPLVRLLGAHAVPLPVAETMLARALLAQAGQEWPDGPITLAYGMAGQQALVAFGLTASHILWDNGTHLVLEPAAAGVPTGVHHGLDSLAACPHGGTVARPDGGLMPIAATLRAADIAGAANRVLALTVDYANQRVQFGKPIGKQQALQQNLAVMAEHCIAARIAAEIAFAGGTEPELSAAATAKIVAGEAAAYVAATAHAVHGAIGISEEYDLQLLTRRLHASRLAAGGEGYWAQQLGRQHFASGLGSVDFVRTSIFRDAA